MNSINPVKASSNAVKFKNLKSNRVWEKTYKTGESLEKADLENIPMQFLYESGEEVVMMNNNSFDQETFSKSDLGDSIQWMEEGESYEVLLFEGSPLSVELDTFVEMEVTETEPGFKGDTATGATKPAILKNGVEVKVPLFIEIGDILKIDTRTGEYQRERKIERRYSKPSFEEISHQISKESLRRPKLRFLNPKILSLEIGLQIFV